MTKRARITALITTLCVCISLFVVGVLAATTASLSVTSTLKFSADGVYVMVDASLKQGADVETAQVLSGEDAPTQPTFKAYSYPRASGQDYPNGEPSTTFFVNESGTQASTWAIGDITYTSENVVVVYEFLVSNYSEFEVTATVEGISEALASYTDQLSITTYTGTTPSDAAATGSPTYTFNIPARTSETTPGQACYKIAVTLNKFTNDITTETIQIDVTFERPPEPIYEYFTYDYYNGVNSITGFSDTYLNLETKPETLVIPSTDGEGNEITLLEKWPPSSTVFDGLESSNVIIQDGITSIGEHAFDNCASLINITIPDSITNIGGWAFYDCVNLEKILIPKSVTGIGYQAFGYCNKLTEVTFSEGLINMDDAIFTDCTSLTYINLPNGITTIADDTFFRCTSLKEVKMPNTVTDIGNNVFWGCNSLSSVTLSNSLINIGNGAFYSCTSLTNISLPESVRNIGEQAFYRCRSLTELVIPEGVEIIKYEALNECLGLEKVDLPSTLKQIEEYAFSACQLLEDLIIPEGVTSIGNSAFQGCFALTSIVLASTLTSIGDYAFNNCPNLTSVTFADPNGWWYASSSTATSGTSITEDLSDPAVAATCLKTTYRNYYWKKS